MWSTGYLPSRKAEKEAVYKQIGRSDFFIFSRAREDGTRLYPLASMCVRCCFQRQTSVGTHETHRLMYKEEGITNTEQFACRLYGTHFVSALGPGLLIGTRYRPSSLGEAFGASPVYLILFSLDGGRKDMGNPREIQVLQLRHAARLRPQLHTHGCVCVWGG